jgi:hypothetical protein
MSRHSKGHFQADLASSLYLLESNAQVRVHVCKPKTRHRREYVGTSDFWRRETNIQLRGKVPRPRDNLLPRGDPPRSCYQSWHWVPRVSPTHYL